MNRVPEFECLESGRVERIKRFERDKRQENNAYPVFRSNSLAYEDSCLRQNIDKFIAPPALSRYNPRFLAACRAFLQHVPV